jgi:trehalose synthase
MVNALQRHATVVAQKSLAEGFGLTVSEGMWKGRPVIDSAVGGIIDQIAEGTGILLRDPADLKAFGRAVRQLFDDQAEATRLGQAAHAHIRENYLGDIHLMRYARLFSTLTFEQGLVRYLSFVSTCSDCLITASNIGRWGRHCARDSSAVTPSWPP